MRVAGVLRSMLLTLGTAELAARLLTPRDRPLAAARVDLTDYFTPEEIERGARFACGQRRLGLARAAIEGLTLVGFARRPPRWLLGRRLPAIAGAARCAAVISLARTALPLPLAAVSRRRAIAVGLVTQSWRGWAVDLVKASAIQTVFAAGGGATVIGLSRRYPRGWWMPAAGASLLVGGALPLLAPVLLDPLFNDFKPLAEGQLRSDVLELADAAGVKVGEVYEVDASRRTTAANAYVTGMGPTKRVVLFDTLIERYSRDEVRVVVAHELAHVRHRDVARGIAFAGLVAPAAAFTVQRLSWILSPVRGTAAAIPALALSLAMVSAPMGLIAGRLSRSLERRADADSLRLSRSANAFVSFERKIALQNVADLDPPWWVRTLLATHPTTLERIGAAVAFQSSSSS